MDAWQRIDSAANTAISTLAKRAIDYWRARADDPALPREERAQAEQEIRDIEAALWPP
ncbi:hypothetical protein VPG91_06105 [Nitrospirillum amazonense]|uniref:hypothetical protein n=1 Tax=Nitrospirillum amazonense TaxID=28077 RepID=UPI002DD4261B|nr:hypothetical protein [Nitrospirillum amazonense]MEC4590552.1 hypothetical protein [Nitrospirillum amazonense]